MARWISISIVIAAVLVSLVVYPDMPERVPTHWNLSGEVDGWSSRLWGTWMVPLFMAVLLVIMYAVPHIDPKYNNYLKFRGMYEALVVLTMAFMLGVHITIVAAATGVPISVGRVIPGTVGGLFAIIGYLLPRAHSNWFVGIRTPWTLSSELSWQKTHAAGGMLFMVTGVLTMAAALVAPQLAATVLIAGGVATIVFAFVYSYLIWRRDKEVR